jgi:hypothetical protein
MQFVHTLLLTAMAVGAVVVSAVVVLVVLFFAFGPELVTDCGQEHRTVFVDPGLGTLTEAQLDGFEDTLDRGQTTSLSLNESEVTSAVLTFAGTDRIRDVTVCFFGDGEAEARLMLDIPGLPDRVVKIRGSVDLSGEHPRVKLSDADLGGLGLLMSLGAQGAIEDVINGVLDDLSLQHTYVASISEGRLVLTGRPGR